MLYLAIPAHNEVATIGVLLWRLRSVLAEFPREYEVVVYDDASTDETADVADQYVQSMPVTVLRGTKSVGYAGAVDALVRHISGHTRYPRRDAMLLLQGDFTDPPGIVPEFARRFEGGADLVIGERSAVVDAPTPVRRLFTAAGWALRPFVRIDGVRDLTSSMRLVRVSVLRDALRTAGEVSICEGDSWTANADLLFRLVPHARRVESVLMEPTYGVRMRDSRRVMMRDALAALRWGWKARGRRAVPTSAPEASVEPAARNTRAGGAAARRRDEPVLSVDQLRERTRDRGRGDSSLEEAPTPGRRDGRRRDNIKPTRDARPSAAEATAREKQSPQHVRPTAPAGAVSSTDTETPAGRVRGGRNPRNRGQDPVSTDEASLILADPFAAPTKNARQRGPRAVRPEPAPPASPVNDAAEPSPERADSLRAESLRADSPYADEASRATAANDLRPSDAVGRDAVGRDAVGRDDGASVDDADSVEPLIDATDTAAAGDDAETRERKRRRNRRSRRRKSKARLDGAEGSVESSREEGSSEDDRAGGQAASRSRDVDGDTGSDDDNDEAGGDAEPSSASNGAETGVDAQSRSRRRGRRGRRGGARRGRGRGAGGDESASGEGASSAEPAAPTRTDEGE